MTILLVVPRLGAAARRVVPGLVLVLVLFVAAHGAA